VDPNVGVAGFDQIEWGNGLTDVLRHPIAMVEIGNENAPLPGILLANYPAMKRSS
jgi:hypothetical protein